MINKRQAGLALATLVLSLSAVGTALAQSYPDKPIRLVVPYPPGASTDAVGRIVGQKLSANIGQTVIVDNRAGASGNIGTEFVSRSAPDGYTFVMGTDATHASNSFLTANPSFDPIKDFTPLAIVAMNPIALVVHPSVPASIGRLAGEQGHGLARGIAVESRELRRQAVQERQVEQHVVELDHGAA